MYQRCFDNASETLFVAGKTPRLSRFAFSDDPKWESGHHVHDNETELIYVKKGVARFTIDSSLYVAHADDIVVIERGRLHAVASDVNDPATTCTCALYGFQFQGAEENQLLQPHSCPVIAAGQGKEVIKTLFNELSVILPQSKNSQTSSLWDAFAYTLAILYYENFKNAYRSEQGYIKKDPAGLIELTDSGKAEAELVFEMHCFFEQVLMDAGISHEQAHIDAGRLEHAISEESFEALKKAGLLHELEQDK